MRSHRGFTLIEIVVAMVLLGLLAAIGANMLNGTMTTSYLMTHNNSSSSQARWAMERMVREIREVQFGASGYTFGSKSATSVSFTKENLTVVTITASGNTVTMQYSSPAATSTLTDQLATGGFTLDYLDQLGAATAVNEDIRFVQITMTVTNTTTGKTESLRTRVFLRNAQMSA